MTIIFSNNNYKYEIESTVKLFIPAVRFKFLYNERNCDDDMVMTRIKHGKNYTYLYAYVRLKNKVKRKSCKISNEIIKIEKDTCEYNLCRLVYLCFIELTKINPEWGMLTGIRPIKKVSKLIMQGMNKNKIFKQLKSKYMISENKLNLAYEIAKTQIPLIKNNTLKTISLYISIPFCPTRCSYCSFVSHSVESTFNLIPDYVKKLCEEIEIVGKSIKNLGITINTIYIGGGTPTSISEDLLLKIMQCIAKNFNISTVCEYNVEAGRADTITEEKLKVIKNMGVTRISINPQTLNDDVLKAIGRKHTAQQTINSFLKAREIGFDNINMDLIAGLPMDTFNSFKNTLDTVIKLAPESITIHTLTLKRSANLYNNSNEHLNSSVSKMLQYSRNNLLNNGYNPYYLYRQKNTLNNLENVGYSKKGFHSLYNIFIMDDSQTILGIGCAASTKFVFNDNRIKRIYNYKFPYEYINRFDELIEKKQKKSQEWINMILEL